jgi:predicted site-specific integrase-resolvase
MDATKWLKPRELAEQERVSLRTVWRWQEKGLIETRRLATRTAVRVRMSDEDDD